MNVSATMNQSKPADDGLEPKVRHIDLERLKHKYTASHEARMSVEEWEWAEVEYRRFLTLKFLYPYITVVPSEKMLAVWHAHILDTRAYRMDCHAVFGRFIDHYPYFGLYGRADCDELENALATTRALYQKHFSKRAADIAESTPGVI